MSLQIEADRRLLDFNTYEDYLDSLVTCDDVTNLRSLNDARKIAEFGYRFSGDSLSKEEFYRRLATVRAHFYPKKLPTDLISKGLLITENFLNELAKREKGNREGTIATIIFLRHFTKTGFEVSGYIDYADRLRKQDWLPIFKGKKRLWPKLDDLSYYHWRSKSTRKNDSINFKVVIDTQQGLLFQCWHDRKIVNVNPTIGFLGWQTTRTIIPTKSKQRSTGYTHTPPAPPIESCSKMLQLSPVSSIGPTPTMARKHFCSKASDSPQSLFLLNERLKSTNNRNVILLNSFSYFFAGYQTLVVMLT